MRLAVSLAFAFATALLAISLVPRGLSGAANPQGNPGAIGIVAADMDVGGNLPNGPLGPLDECSQVEPGGALTFDIIVDAIHPADGIRGYQLQLTYDPTVFRVEQAQAVMMLGANIGSQVEFNNDTLPDTDGTFNITAQDISNSTQPEFGQGILARITLLNVAAGESDIQFANATVIGGNNQPIPIGNPPKKGKGGTTTCRTPTPTGSPSPTPTPTPSPTPSPSPSPSPTASPNPFTHPVPPRRTAPSAAEKALYSEKLARLRAHSHEFPLGFADALKSLSEPVTIQFDCPKPPSKVKKVIIKVTTSIVAWDPKAAVPGSAGTYQWNLVKTEINDDVKTWTFNNWLMMDPSVMADQEASPPFGPVADEALLYHELMHGQLQMDYMKTQAFKDSACMCKWKEQGEAHEHEIIKGAVNGYFEVRFPGATVDIANGSTKVKEDGTFEIDLGEVKKNPWTVNFQDPEGGSNMTDVDVVDVGGRYVLKGKLIDKTKPGKILVVIDPPSYFLLGGFDEFLLVSPDGDPATWGDLDCDGDADSADALLVLSASAGVDSPVPPDGCPTLGDDVYIDGLERPWGDTDCSREIDFHDALVTLQSNVNVDVLDVYIQCPPVESEVTLTVPGP